MKRKGIITLILVACALLIAFGINYFTVNENVIETSEYTIQGDGLRFTDEQVTEKDWSTAEDTTYEYQVNGDSTLSITHRKLPNDTKIVFASWDNSSRISSNIEITWKEEVTDFQEFDAAISHESDGTYGEDPTTLPMGTMQTKDTHYYISKSYQSTKEEKTYENGDTSTLRHLVEETENPEDKVSLTLRSSGNDISEAWLMESDSRFFTSEEERRSWVTHMEESYKMSQKWLTPAGAYIKLPWSVEPFNELGYGRNIGRITNKEALERFEENGSVLYESLTLNSVAMAEAYQAEKDSFLWPTEYTSTWLKEPYGITAPYVDTRHNETLALFFLKAEKVLSQPGIKALGQRYAEYLLEEIKQGHVLEVGEYYLPTDYPPVEGEPIPHASLNHVLGGIYYLLQVYEDTGEEKYLDTAYDMRQAIEHIGSDWIREDDRAGDLWYQLNADGTFSGDDYATLTYVDLEKNQEAWSKTKYGKSDVFQQLLESKKDYIDENR